MIGFEEAAERTDYDLLGARPPTTVIGLLRANWHRVVGVALVAAATTSLALLSAADLLDSQTTFAYRNDLHVNVNVNDAVSRATQWHGVSLGGWLVMEINPSKRKTDSPMDLRPGWMYDQIEASSELDFITELRACMHARNRNKKTGGVTKIVLFLSFGARVASSSAPHRATSTKLKHREPVLCLSPRSGDWLLLSLSFFSS